MSENKYGKPQDGELTERSWREKGYRLTSSAVGKERWTGLGTRLYYTSNDVEFVGIDEIKKEDRGKSNEQRRQLRRVNDVARFLYGCTISELPSYDADKVRQIASLPEDQVKDVMTAERQRIEDAIKWHGDCHTSKQWLDMGRCPKRDAQWHQGNARYGQSPDYCYCHIGDTYEPEEAELRSIVDAEAKAYNDNPLNYNGRMMTY